MWSQAGPNTVAAMEQTADILQNLGARVEEVDLPSEVSDVGNLARIQKIITNAEAQISFLREYRIGKAELSPEIQNFVENGSNHTHSELVEASDEYTRMRELVNNLAQNYSVILTPSAVDEALLGLGDMGSPTFNTFWAGFHMPVVNIPAFIGLEPTGCLLVYLLLLPDIMMHTS
ncbi:amidase signature domain-containing protein [Penicillium herquei]|nr:amidase signature domain-containing protein [Penicillium herquei]